MKKKLCLLLSLLLLLGSLTAMHANQPEEADTDAQTRNLHKLAKVWGFTKYTHMAFLTGEKCWDEELLNLIPVIRAADEKDVNDILYEWFVGLGDSGYDSAGNITFAEMRPIFIIESPHRFRSLPEFIALYTELSEADWLIAFSASECNSGGFFLMLKTDENNLLLLQALGDRHDFSVTVIEKSDLNLLQMADTSWINESFLGAELFEAISRFQGTPVMDITAAPIRIGADGHITWFGNEPVHRNMDFSGDSYRLLGLFRLWNAMEYYFPYRDILDRCWSELLLEHIPMMLEGNDRVSYELTLASLASNLRDAHIWFNRSLGFRHDNLDFLDYRFGRYRARVHLTEAEGQLVVYGHLTTGERTALRRGDVIVRLNGKEIEEAVNEMLRYVPYPNREIALSYLTIFHQILRSHERQMSVDVIRGGTEITIDIRGVAANLPQRPAPVSVSASHYIFPELNIGLINPAFLSHTLNIPFIMNELADTDGLIVDLRQYPAHMTMYQLADYLVYPRQSYFIISLPASFSPGVFIAVHEQHAGGLIYDDSFRYMSNVVVLMNEMTMSWGETSVMMLQGGENVTIMGSNSIGANGNISQLRLPCGLVMLFSGVGVYTPEGGQTQRIGLSPDIFVRPTIEGIREGRDEVLEAAIEFLLGSN